MSGSPAAVSRAGPAAPLDVVVPAGIDDPARPSGGNVYDRRLCRGLLESGWAVREHRLAGSWPDPDAGDRAALGAVLGRVPAGGIVLVDGLIASAAPAELARVAAAGARLVVLVHLPLGVAAAPGSLLVLRERAALNRADTLIVTSRWTHGWLVDHYDLAAERVHVAEPGVDTAALTRPSPAGGRLLCVGALAPHKGQDLLVAALGSVTAHAGWRCLLVGPEVDPAYARSVRDRVAAADLGNRVELTGPLTPSALSQLYAESDLLVAPSRVETYGMVVSEALARGIPIVASTAGGLPRAVGLAADVSGPGLLVPPDNPGRLADTLQRWLTDETLRRRLRAAAVARRAALRPWSATVEEVAATLTELAA